MAAGGIAGHFCATDNPHQDGCPYYMPDGGEVPPDWDSLSSAPPSPAAQPQTEETPDWDSLSTVPPSSDEAPDWDSLSQTPPDNEASSQDQHRAAAQAIGEGIGGPLFVGMERAIGVSPEEINRLHDINPIQNKLLEGAIFAGSLATGMGGASAIAKAAKLATGAKVLQGAIEGAAFVGGDEITKGLLGHGDPSHPIGMALLHSGIGALLGGGTIAFLDSGIAGKAIDKAAPAIQKKITNVLEDLGTNPTSKILTKGLMGYGLSQIPGARYALPVVGSAEHMLQPIVQKIIGKPLRGLDKYIGDAILSATKEGNVISVPSAVKFGTKIAGSAKRLQPMLEGLMKAGNKEIAPPIGDIAHDEIKAAVQAGLPQETGMQGFAEGGEVGSEPQDDFAKAFPAHSALLAQARGRIYNYLNTLRPQPNPQKLLFDQDLPDSAREQNYDKAVSIAANPLSVLNSIQKGNLTPNEVHHFKSMFPESHEILAKQLTKKMVESQAKGEKPPPYGKRQALSLFLGAPLESSMTPLAIQAAQASFAIKQAGNAAQQASTKPKRSTARMGKISQAFATDDQAREMRQQAQKS